MRGCPQQWALTSLMLLLIQQHAQGLASLRMLRRSGGGALSRARPGVLTTMTTTGEAPESSSTLETMELTGRIHTWGGKLKTGAVAAQLRFGAAKAPMKPVHLAQCVTFYLLFVAYRAYRGFFVIIPAVFSQVKGRLRAGIVEAETELNADVDPQTGKLRRRSAMLISFGAAIVTGIYSIKTVVGGLAKGIGMALGKGRGKAAADKDRSIEESASSTETEA